MKGKHFSEAFGLLFLPVTLLYLELILRVTSDISLLLPGTVTVILTALGVGLLFSAIAGLFPSSKAAGWFLGVLAELSIIWFLVAYFTNNAYKVFMDVTAIFSQAGNVVNGFAGNLAITILSGLPMILLYHIPLAVLILLRKKLTPPSGKRWIRGLALLLAAVLFAGCGLAVGLHNEAIKDKYTIEYSYDSAVRSFGVLTGLVLNLRYDVNEDSTDAQLSFTPVETPAAAVTESAPQALPSEEAPELSEEPEVIEYGYNMLDLDFDALMKQKVNTGVLSLHEYVQSLTPSRQNKYTGRFAGKNLILITAEAFTKEVIDPERTPTLYRLSHEGILFEDFYQPAWGGSTSTGEYSFLTGLAPTTTSAMMNTIGHNLYFTMGNQLQRQDYFSAAFHNGTHTYYSRNKTHTNFGYDTFMALGNGMEKGISLPFPQSDMEMAQYTLPMYIDHQPFSVYYMSISGHAGYTFKNNAMSAKNRDMYQDMDAPEQIRAYYACQQELEYMLEYLVTELEKAGIADDTVIALCADHYPYGLQKSSTWYNSSGYLLELFGEDETRSNLVRDHNAAIIWSGCMKDWEDTPVVSGPSYSLDIVPTLSNLFGLPYDSRLLIGRDVLSDEPALVIWPEAVWKSDYGYFDGRTFIPNEGVEVEEGYVDTMRQIVRNKLAFCKGVLKYDYYRVLFGADEN